MSKDTEPLMDTAPLPVYTVGNEAGYDQALAKTTPDKPLKKLGRYNDYPGGFAVGSVADGHRLIREFGKVGEWAVYQLQASWEADTVPSVNGWWRALVNDSIVIGKVSS